MELSVSFENEQRLINFFQESLDEIEEEVKRDITRDISKIMLKVGSRQEKKIFRYIANKVMGHVNPPGSIENRRAFEGITWKPLAKSTIKRKGHKRKWIDSGSLKNYLRGLSATYWYGNPRVTVSPDLSSVTYYSIFNNSRKPFRAHDQRGVAQELKITGEGESYGKDGDNINRPIFGPMEKFLFLYAEDLMNEAINDYMEENYGLHYAIPTTY